MKNFLIMILAFFFECIWPDLANSHVPNIVSNARASPVHWSVKWVEDKAAVVAFVFVAGGSGGGGGGKRPAEEDQTNRRAEAGQHVDNDNNCKRQSKQPFKQPNQQATAIRPSVQPSIWPSDIAAILNDQIRLVVCTWETQNW